MSRKMVFSFRLSTTKCAIAAAIVLFAGLSGCGFKSDLFIPAEEPVTPLPDVDDQAALETGVKPPYLSESKVTAEEVEGIEVDVATAIATEGQILIAPNEEKAKPAPVKSDSQGVPVDISDVGISLNDLVTE